MSRLRQVATILGPYIAAFIGGVFGAAALAFLAAWIAFKLFVDDGQDATNAFVVLPFFCMGAVVGFWVGIGLVVFGRHRFQRKRIG